MPRCRWQTCGQPADRCDLDHITDFDHAGDLPDGGVTVRANLAPRCRDHHNAKTHGGWEHSQDPDGTEHVTSPLNKTYTVPPDTVPSAQPCSPT